MHVNTYIHTYLHTHTHIYIILACVSYLLLIISLWPLLLAFLNRLIAGVNAALASAIF
jgi:hypothetical protein